MRDKVFSYQLPVASSGAMKRKMAILENALKRLRNALGGLKVWIVEKMAVVKMQRKCIGENARFSQLPVTSFQFSAQNDENASMIMIEMGGVV